MTSLTPLARAPLTYPEVGATTGTMPPGYHHAHHRAVVGAGRADFTAAAAAVTQWRMHRGAGIRVRASGAVAREGTVVRLELGVGPLRLRMPCRVVTVIDEPNRRGFAYGTLPGHPEVGEEAFVVELGADGLVRLDISAFSRPGWRLVALSGPLGRWAQRRGLAGYARAVRTAVSQSHRT